MFDLQMHTGVVAYSVQFTMVLIGYLRAFSPHRLGYTNALIPRDSRLRFGTTCLSLVPAETYLYR